MLWAELNFVWVEGCCEWAPWGLFYKDLIPLEAFAKVLPAAGAAEEEKKQNKTKLQLVYFS